MSILIHGVGMPPKGMCKTITIFDDGVVVEGNGSEKLGIAVPVPHHGRLIDADAYRAEMKKRQAACAEWRDDIKSGGGYGTELYYRADSFLGAMCEAKLMLDKIPTIIPAEPTKEET